jgi:non-specific serine/threonine protein kinase
MLSLLSRRFDVLVNRKRDVGARHRSLWAALDWSYHLLPPTLQGFFARLSVFRGGWTADAAEAVCQEPQVLDHLEHLSECSLILAEDTEGGMRFRMLETLREFGRELLSEEEHAALQQRHAEYFSALYQEKLRRIWAGESLTAMLSQFMIEQENLRSVLAWSRQSEDRAELGLRLAMTLTRFWGPCGYMEEGRVFLKEALEHARGIAVPLRANALNALGNLTAQQGAVTPDRERMQALVSEARALCQEALALYEALGATQGIAETIGSLSEIARLQGDYTAARAFGKQLLAYWQERGATYQVAWSLIVLGKVELLCDRVAARPLFERSLAIFRELKQNMGASDALLFLSEIARDDGELATARAFADECLALRRAYGDKRRFTNALSRFAEASGPAERRVRLLGAAAAAIRSEDADVSLQAREIYDHAVAMARTALGEAAFAAAWEAGRAMTPEQAISYVLEGL